MKRAGETAALYVDVLQTVHVGDYIRTLTGRTYLVTAVRIQQRGKHVGRQHLKTVVMAPGHVVEPDAEVITIAWYARSRGVRR
jgi:hypothetical protein